MYDIVMWRWLDMRFGLVTGFIGHLKLITTGNYSIITNSYTVQITTASTTSSQSACLHWLSPGNGSQCHRFLGFCVPWFWSSLAGAYLMTNSVLLCNSLQQWGSLHQVVAVSDSDCLPSNSTSTRVEISVKAGGRQIPPTFMLISCSAYSSILKTEAICSSETLVSFQRTLYRVCQKFFWPSSFQEINLVSVNILFWTNSVWNLVHQCHNFNGQREYFKATELKLKIIKYLISTRNTT
jgi:hypothetical protein